jgi:hypothetical protein
MDVRVADEHSLGVSSGLVILRFVPADHHPGLPHTCTPVTADP